MLIVSGIFGAIFRIGFQIFFFKTFKIVPPIIVFILTGLSAFTGNPKFIAFVFGIFLIETVDSLLNFSSKRKLDEAKKSYETEAE